MKKEILFISHEASRTGAPIILLNFLRWFKQNTDIPFRIILRTGGELESEFAQLAPTLLLGQKVSRELYDRIKGFLLRSVANYRIRQWLMSADIGLIYSNTLTNGGLLESLRFLNCPVIYHVHELEYVIRRYGIKGFEKTEKQTTHFIACADAVKCNLIDHHHIGAQDITVIHEFIPISSILENILDHKMLKNELGLPESTFLVGASGTFSWRKGTDLFIQLAHVVKRKVRDAPIQFVWVGGNCDGTEYLGLQQDILKAGLGDYVHFIGSKPNPLDYFSCFDVFVLTSREDPYPLVCLENAFVGKPIICFDKGGGEPEFVENDCGFVVPYLNLDIMADSIIQLYQSPDLVKKLGQNAKKKVCDRHDLKTTAPKILEVIKQCLNQ